MAHDNPRYPIKIVITGENPGIVPINSSLKEVKQDASTYIKATQIEIHQVSKAVTNPPTSGPKDKPKGSKPRQALGMFALGAISSILVLVVLGCFWGLYRGIAPDQLVSLLKNIVEPLVTSLVGIISGAAAAYIVIKKKGP